MERFSVEKSNQQFIKEISGAPPGVVEENTGTESNKQCGANATPYPRIAKLCAARVDRKSCRFQQGAVHLS